MNADKSIAAEENCCCSKKAAEIKEESCSCHEEKNNEEVQSFKSCCAAPAKEGEEEKQRNKYVSFIVLGISLAALIVSYINPFENSGLFLHYLDFGWIAVILCGTTIFINAFKNLSRGKVTSGLLISISILACITLEILTLADVLPSDGHGHGNIFAAGEVAFLMYLGELIEDITVAKARSGITKLMELAPTTAKFMVNGELIEKPVKDVKIGDRVIVLPNDIISVDGIIISGETAVDESIMTGESVPVDKKAGDKVYGGTWNKSGALEIEVTKSNDDMAVNKLKKLIEEAEGKKAPISRTADKWARIIVPGAVILAFVIFFATYFGFTNRDIYTAIMRGVTMLVVFCPCALALATPTAIAAGLGAGSKRGVLIKSGASLEELARVNIVALDKTGTLTTGQLEVTDIIAYGMDKSRLMAIAGATESLSEHPLAKAITKRCKAEAELPEVTNVKSLVGTGVESEINGNKIICAKWDYLDEIKVDKTVSEADAKRLLESGKTLVAVVENGKLAGIIALSDEIKDGSKECVGELNKSGIKTIMLTGDNKYVAKEVAEKTGLTDYKASLLPEEKLSEIERLKQGNKVCMVGDGVNDAPALASANCSIAMGALGSDVAIETADIALMNNDITNVSTLVKFSKKVLTTIKINIILSMTINVLAVILNLLGFLNPVTGALIHNCSSVIVVLNSSLLLSRWGGKKPSISK